MKCTRYLPLLLALLLLAGCAAPAQEAVETPEPTPAETPQPAESLPSGSPERAAVAYLTAMAENMFLYTDHDLRSGSVASLSDAERAALPLAGVSFEALTMTSRLHAGVKFDPPNTPSPATAMLQIEDGMDYVIQKADYWKYSHSKTNPVRSDWDIAYQIEQIHTNGAFAQVIVNESVSFQIPGASSGTTIGTPYEVILYSHNGEWLVLDITADDAFDGTNKWSGFNAETAKAELDQAMANPTSSPQIIVE